MKKILVILAVLVSLGSAIYYFASSHRESPAGPASGGVPVDFVLGYSGSSAIKLHDFLGKYDVVLVFLDDGRSSEKFEALFSEKFKALFSGKKGLLWFNVKKEDGHAIIEEKAGTLASRYRAPYSAIPAYYSFGTLPSALLADKSGTIKLVYNGYSPTMLADILASLPGRAK